MTRLQYLTALLPFAIPAVALAQPEPLPECHPVTIDASACDPDLVEFTLDSTNPWYPLTPGLQVILAGEEDGEVVRVERTVLEETREIGGVEVHLLEHKAYIDGEIHEIALNFYVETVDGTVCYFGEDVEFYEDGVLVNMGGTWRVGVDGAKPGVIMPADPQVGDAYYQEFAPGSALDQGRVDAIDLEWTLDGEDYDVIRVIDTNPIDDEEQCEPEEKRYARGVGEIQDTVLHATSVTFPAEDDDGSDDDSSSDGCDATATGGALPMSFLTLCVGLGLRRRRRTR